MSKVLCSFGLFSDVQYADQEVGHNFRQDRTRYYKSALTLLRQAVTELRKPKHDISFILQLGDLIDGFCGRSQPPYSDVALQRTLSELHAFPKPVYHVWGNHEMYNFRRTELLDSELNSSRLLVGLGPKNGIAKPPADANCYHFSVRGFRVVVLDQYEVGMLGQDKSSARYKQAESIVRSHNKNIDLNESAGLIGVERRFCKFNGGISAEQLKWLDSVLQYAEKCGEKVLVAGHIPICLESTDEGRSLCWDYQDILSTLHRYQCVVAYFAGHDHQGGFATDAHGIHHITVHAIVETAPDDNAFAIVHVHTDRLVMKGYGRVPSRELFYRKW